MWSYIVGGLKKGPFAQKIALWDQIKGSYIINGGLKIEACKIEGPLYLYIFYTTQNLSDLDQPFKITKGQI